jgi:hypothetical protein
MDCIMCTCIIYIYIYIYIYKYIVYVRTDDACVGMWVCGHVGIYECVCMHIYIYIYMFVCVCMHIHIYTYIYIYIYLYACVHVHVYSHTTINFKMQMRVHCSSILKASQDQEAGEEMRSPMKLGKTKSPPLYHPPAEVASASLDQV